MAASELDNYTLFRRMILQAIRKKFSERENWLSELDLIVSSLIETGLPEEIGAAIPSYMTFFLEEVRQGLVDPFASGSGTSGSEEDPPWPVQKDLLKNLKEPEQAPERVLIDQLIAATRLYNSSEAIEELFDFAIRFRAFAPFNAMLLHIQKPGLTQAATARDWWERFGRVPKVGKRPLLILRTMGPVDFVFDILDTEGDDLPPGAFTFPTFGNLTAEQFGEFAQKVAKERIDIVELDAGDAQAGWVRLIAQSESRNGKNCYELAYNRNHTAPTRFVTVAHELAHLYLGHLGSDGGRRVPDRRNILPAMKEVEAEMTAYLVAKRNGLEPRSERYLAQYQGAFVDLNLYAVIRAANAVETAMGISATKLWTRKY